MQGRKPIASLLPPARLPRLTPDSHHTKADFLVAAPELTSYDVCGSANAWRVSSRRLRVVRTAMLRPGAVQRSVIDYT